MGTTSSPYFSNQARASCAVVQSLSASASERADKPYICVRMASMKRGMICGRLSLISLTASPLAKVDVSMPCPKGIAATTARPSWRQAARRSVQAGPSTRIRLQAIILLEPTFHRGRIQDATIAACVARKGMEIEERDFYRDVDSANGFPLTSSPRL